MNTSMVQIKSNIIFTFIFGAELKAIFEAKVKEWGKEEGKGGGLVAKRECRTITVVSQTST